MLNINLHFCCTVPFCMSQIKKTTWHAVRFKSLLLNVVVKVQLNFIFSWIVYLLVSYYNKNDHLAWNLNEIMDWKTTSFNLKMSTFMILLFARLWKLSPARSFALKLLPRSTCDYITFANGSGAWKSSSFAVSVAYERAFVLGSVYPFCM